MSAYETLHSSLTVRTPVRVEAHADADTAGFVLKIGGGINNAVLQPFLTLINIELKTRSLKRSKSSPSALIKDRRYFHLLMKSLI